MHKLRVFNILSSVAIVSSLATIAVVNTSCINNTVVGDIECDQTSASYGDSITLTAKINHAKGLAHLRCAWGQDLSRVDGSKATEVKNGVATFTISSKPFYPFKLDLYIENHDKVSNNQIAVTFGKSDDQFSFRNEASLASWEATPYTTSPISANDAEIAWEDLTLQQQVADVLWGLVKSSINWDLHYKGDNLTLDINKIIVQDFSFENNRKFTIEGTPVVADVLTKCSFKVEGVIKAKFLMMTETIINPIFTIQNLLVNSIFSKDSHTADTVASYNLLPLNMVWTDDNKDIWDLIICQKLNTQVSVKYPRGQYTLDKGIYSCLFDYNCTCFPSHYFRNVDITTP